MKMKPLTMLLVIMPLGMLIRCNYEREGRPIWEEPSQPTGTVSLDTTVPGDTKLTHQSKCSVTPTPLSAGTPGGVQPSCGLASPLTIYPTFHTVNYAQ